MTVIIDRQDSKSRKWKKMLGFAVTSAPPQVTTVTAKSRCTPLSGLDNLAKGRNAKSCLALVVILLLAVVGFLHFSSFLTGGIDHSRLGTLAKRVSYLIGKEWRYQVGIYNPNYTYPGLIPPYTTGSSHCSSSMDSEAGPFFAPTVQNFGSADLDYDVCLAVSIGDDGDRPHDKSLPYPLVSRLIDVLGEQIKETKLNGSFSPSENVQVLVGVDYGSIVCKMVRDAFYESAGVRTHCIEFEGVEEGTKCRKLVAGQSERFVPQIPLQWSEAVEWQSMKSVDLDCEDASRQAPALPEKDWQPTIVTGFSSNHMVVGLLMLRSIGKAAKEGRGLFNVSVVVWAMEIFGQEEQSLLDCVIHELNYKYGVNAEVRLYDWSAHPSWMRINPDLGYFGGTGEYAWKAVMVHTILRERGFVLWADAGDRFHDTESLIGTLKSLNSTGFVSRKSHGTVYTRSHPLGLKYFRANVPEIWDLENCEAAIAGFTLKKYEELARPWYDCCMTRQCIAPDGSDRSNHRQDQFALTILSILSKNPCTGAHPNFSDHLDDDPTLRDVSGAYLTQCYVDPLVLNSQGTHKSKNRPHGIID